MDQLHTIFGFKGNNKDAILQGNESVVFLIEDVSQIFVALRKVFLILIINDAYIMLCKPFQFKEYLESKSMMKRYLIALGFWIICHTLHMISIVTNLSYMISKHISVQVVFVILSGFKWTSCKHVFVLAYDGILLIVGAKRCSAQLAALHEMDQNEFAKNGHCESLFKMSVIFCVLTAVSMVTDILKPVADYLIIQLKPAMFLDLAKASFDTFFSIIIMITFVVFFPGLRPRLNSN